MKLTQAIALSVLAISFANTASAGPRNWPSAFPSKSSARIETSESRIASPSRGQVTKYSRAKSLRRNSNPGTVNCSYARSAERKIRLSRYNYAGNS